MPVHILTLVPCSHVPKEDSKAVTPSPQIIALRDALQSNGGDIILPVLAGDATVFPSQALDPVTGPFDAVVARFRSMDDYKKAIDNQAYNEALELGGGNVMTYGFDRKSLVVDWLYPALKKMYGLFGVKADCETSADDEQPPEDHPLYQPNGEQGIDKYKRHIAKHSHQGFYMIEMITRNETPEGKKADGKYGKAWLHAALAYGVHFEIGGKTVSLDQGPRPFGEIIIAHYPSREMYVKWMESKYFAQVADDRIQSTLDLHLQISLPLY